MAHPRHLFLLLALLAAPLWGLVAQPRFDHGRPLGGLRPYHGVYVTNFEIGFFVECEATSGGCDDWAKQEMRWLTGGTAAIEAKLMACIRRWNGSRDRWALYAIAFLGRETLDRQPKQFLHDTERKLLLNEVLALELIGTDKTVQWALPRYRRHASMTC